MISSKENLILMPNSQRSSYLSKQEEINRDLYSGKFIIGWMYYFAHILRWLQGGS